MICISVFVRVWMWCSANDISFVVVASWHTQHVTQCWKETWNKQNLYYPESEARNCLSVWQRFLAATIQFICGRLFVRSCFHQEMARCWRENRADTQSILPREKNTWTQKTVLLCKIYETSQKIFMSFENIHLLTLCECLWVDHPY